MLEGMTRLLPTAEVGFLGMKRDEDTLEVETYANRLPDDLSGRQCFVIDPMLATGHTLVAAIEYLLERGARDVTAICLISAPEGVKQVEGRIGGRANVTVVTAAVDERLKSDAADFIGSLNQRGNKLNIRHELTLRKRVYDAADWPGFRKAVKAHKDLADEWLVLEKK